MVYFVVPEKKKRRDTLFTNLTKPILVTVFFFLGIITFGIDKRKKPFM